MCVLVLLDCYLLGCQGTCISWVPVGNILVLLLRSEGSGPVLCESQDQGASK